MEQAGCNQFKAAAEHLYRPIRLARCGRNARRHGGLNKGAAGDREKRHGHCTSEFGNPIKAGAHSKPVRESED